MRVAAKDTYVGFAQELVDACLPQVDDISEVLRRSVRFCPPPDYFQDRVPASARQLPGNEIRAQKPEGRYPGGIVRSFTRAFGMGYEKKYLGVLFLCNGRTL